MPNTDFTPSFLVFGAEIGFSSITAKKYKDDAVSLKNSTDGCTPSFHLLSTIAFELFPKIIVASNVCLKYKDLTKDKISDGKIREEIKKEMQIYGHDLKKLYEAFPELMENLNIESIEIYPPKDKTRDYFAWEYRFRLKGNIYEISVKDVEAIRYGSFAKNRDVIMDCQGDDLIIDLLNKLEAFVKNKIKEDRLELMKYFSKDG